MSWSIGYVTFSMSKLTGETHSATFGPKAYLKTISNSFQGSPVFDPRGIWPSSPPGSIVETRSAHGNGFANTGVLDRDASTPPPPGAKITFTQKGVYHFECVIHPFMKGTVIVQ